MPAGKVYTTLWQSWKQSSKKFKGICMFKHHIFPIFSIFSRDLGCPNLAGFAIWHRQKAYDNTLNHPRGLNLVGRQGCFLQHRTSNQQKYLKMCNLYSKNTFERSAVRRFAKGLPGRKYAELVAACFPF